MTKLWLYLLKTLLKFRPKDLSIVVIHGTRQERCIEVPIADYISVCDNTYTSTPSWAR